MGFASHRPFCSSQGPLLVHGRIFMALFIPGTFNWLVHPWGIAIPVTIAAVLRSLRPRRHQGAAALRSS